MPISLNNLLHYWRASLQDSSQHIDAEALNLYDVPLEVASTGEIAPELCDQLWSDAGQVLAASALSRMQVIPVLIAPVLLCAGREQGQGYADLRNAQVPVWLVCQCDRQGKIRLNEKVKAQDAIIIDRDTIAPLASNVPTYTTLSIVKGFLDRKQLKTDQGGIAWSDVWDYVVQLFENVFHATLENWQSGLMVNQGCFISYGERPADTAMAIRSIYERLIEHKNKQHPHLLSALLQNGSGEDVECHAASRAAKRFNHVAQMGGSYSLNNGQRLALSAILSSSEDPLVAVNGPPGTGKTTLLQSVVGSLWAQAAIKGKEPPVILASSTNNQAITNILDSFGSACLPADHRLSSSSLSKRWVPKVEQYGLFLPSEARAEGADKTYQIACCLNRKTWIGLPAAIENKEYVEQAEAFWLVAAQSWNRDIEGVHEGVTLLQGRLIALDKTVRTCWRLWDAFHVFVDVNADATAVRENVNAWKNRKRTLDGHTSDLERRAHQALTFFHTPLSLFAWIPFVRRKIWGRVHAYLSQHKLTDKSWTWETVLTERAFRAWLTQRSSLINKHHKEVATKISAWNEWEQHVKVLLPSADAAELILNEDVLQVALDLHIRTEMFLLAGRYWEGRWILEMKEVLNKSTTNPKLLSGWNKENCEARWRRFAKLTPCLVATAYTAPRLFEYFDGDNRSLFGFIDLLIVEEAGQVAPHVGGALFALARRAMVVGDVQQIEPVWGVSPAIDGGNIEHYELSSARTELEARGLLASEGSIMKMAQMATAFSSSGHNGLFLDEHWRCRRSTISYCNDLAYGGELTPKREDGVSGLPPLGYAHIAGTAERRGTSWVNVLEAQVIATWVDKHRTSLGKDKKLGERLAIVTPFKAQIAVLQKALKEHGLGNEHIAVGTVHTLQGAERDIVIFSSVYSADTARSLFFDRGVNMLNVAVSRAKESFLIFGDMRLFRPERASPSGLLAKHIFRNADYEILDVEPTLAFRVREDSAESIERIDALDGHRHLLTQALDEAQERLLIISPYLSIHALEADEIPKRLISAAQRGVKITICYDPAMNKAENGQLHSRVQQALEVLGQTPATICAVSPVHNKTIAVDSAWIVEGSFNWLSASRQRNGIYQRHETSILYKGSKAVDFIGQAWANAMKLQSNRKSD